MPNTSSDSLVFYPAYCFSLSPTHTTWARLTATDVFGLIERAGFEGMSMLLLSFQTRRYPARDGVPFDEG